MPEPEIIGDRGCPILRRWEPITLGEHGPKLIVHAFYPGVDDRDYHDHPRSFLTLVLWGSYTDLTPDGHRDRLRPGSIRFRRAEHAHRTIGGPRGCWTIVLMWRRRREWGFWQDGVWWPARDYVSRFSGSLRCPD